MKTTSLRGRGSSSEDSDPGPLLPSNQHRCRREEGGPPDPREGWRGLHPGAHEIRLGQGLGLGEKKEERKTRRGGETRRVDAPWVTLEPVYGAPLKQPPSAIAQWCKVAH